MEDMRYEFDLLIAKNEKLNENERIYKHIFDVTKSAIFFYQKEIDQICSFGNVSNIIEYPLRQGRDFSYFLDIVELEDREKLKLAMMCYKEEKDYESVICKIKDKRAWWKFEVFIIYDQLEVIEFILKVSDVTKEHSQNKELEYLVYFDTETGLFNRNHFIMKFSELIHKARENNEKVSLLMIDIDDFRRINNGLGVLAGDELIQEFGQLIKGFIDQDIIAGHMHSDVFAMAIYGSFGIKSVEYIYHKIEEKLSEGFVLSNGQRINITISVGIAEYPDTSIDALELINYAKIIMYRAKKNGKDSLQYFDAIILKEFLKNIELENKLKEAILKNSFCLYFQPQYYMQNFTIRGMEVLIRWPDQSGMISPATFIPVAENNGSIVPIGNWVIDEGLKIFAQWRMKYDTPMILSLNISAIQYKKPEFFEFIISVMEVYGVNPEEVELEITETILIEDLESMRDKLHDLKEYGFRISLDDFGTGYSSLSYLKELPITTLKIDRSIIEMSVHEKTSEIIVESIIDMSHRLGYEIVAEGVESECQFDALKDMGCDIVQGYYTGKPMNEETFEQLLIEYQ